MCDGGHHAREPVLDASSTSLCHLGTDLRKFRKSSQPTVNVSKLVTNWNRSKSDSHPSGPSPSCQVMANPTGAVWHGQWTRRHLLCRDRALGELLASRWPWRHSPEDPQSRQGSHRGWWGLQPPKAMRQGPGHLRHCWGNNILFVFPQKKKKKMVRHFPGWATEGATHPHFLESREQNHGRVVKMSIT